MARCLYCYKELKEGENQFHRSCLKKIFGDTILPIMEIRHSDLETLAEQVIRSQTTLTGVQAKLSLDIVTESKQKRFTIVGLWGRYILKPQTELYPHLPELEDLTMHLAEVCGIDVVPHTLITLADGQLCYLTRRIDRLNDGYKLAMEDMCQLSDRLTEHKYKGSYEQISKIIQKHSSVSRLDNIKFWQIVLFSWLVGNSDMHLKNFSLYKPIGYGHILSPAYDLLSTKLVLPTDTEELALNLNGKKRKINKNDFIKAMESSGIDTKTIDNLFKRFKKVQPLLNELIDISFLPINLKEEYKQLITTNYNTLFAE